MAGEPAIFHATALHRQVHSQPTCLRLHLHRRTLNLYSVTQATGIPAGLIIVLEKTNDSTSAYFKNIYGITKAAAEDSLRHDFWLLIDLYEPAETSGAHSPA